MDHRTHERGVGMLNTPYVKKDTIKNFFPVPNAVFDLGLHHMEINIYAYLLRIEDRRTYQCIVSYPTIAKKLGISVNTVAKYVAALEEHGLIRTERTEIITKDGRTLPLRGISALNAPVLPHLLSPGDSGCPSAVKSHTAAHSGIHGGISCALFIVYRNKLNPQSFGSCLRPLPL